MRVELIFLFLVVWKFFAVLWFLLWMSSCSSSRKNSIDSDSDDSTGFMDPLSVMENLRVADDDDAVSVEGKSSNQTSFFPIVEKDSAKASDAKEQGNVYFREKSYALAVQSYSLAISLCPEDEKNQDDLAVYFGNRAAAYFMEKEYQQTVDDCNRSINLKPKYIKVLARRAQAQEALENYDEALKDMKEIEGLDPGYPKLQETIKKLEKLNEAKLNAMKDEALGKLKELGNSILGNFGMSLDNFKMTQDPTTGGWNLSMQK